jgi:MoxR-like ATPase
MDTARITIRKKDFEKFDNEERDHVLAVGRGAAGILLETTKTGGGRHYISISLDGTMAQHRCEASKRGAPCWHLAAALAAVATINGALCPFDHELTVDRMKPFKCSVQDVTPLIFSRRRGDFEYFRVSGKAPEEPVVATAEIWPEPLEPLPESLLEVPPGIIPEMSEDDAWLLNYGLPSIVLQKALFFRDDQKRRLSEKQMALIPKPRYMQVGHELISATTALLYGPSGNAWEPVLLKGPRGTGKSTLADTLGSILMLPVVRITGGVDVNAEWLLGSRTLDYDEAGKQRVVHEPGLLLQAVQDGALLVVEEVNMLLPEVTSLLHSLLDWQRILPVPGVGHVRPPKSFRLAACMNLNYAGTRSLNEAFKDRFREIKVPYLPENVMAEIIAQNGVEINIAATMASIFYALVKRVDNEDITDEALSIRSLIRAGREIEAGFNPKDAVLSNLTESIDDDLTAKVVKEVIDSRLA